ncbi:hypothetical protein [uncultured Gulosibacter sp.]|uniref:hypothetical protein n=1 Tax=uncultured Gulosibacter sp. TaxID=1339167 RepID=UPI00288BC698|nr:hypothetical protein [uncultured Gulosibacter sp.]
MLTAAILGAISLALYLVNSIGMEIHRCPNYAPEGIHENIDIKSELSLFPLGANCKYFQITPNGDTVLLNERLSDFNLTFQLLPMALGVLSFFIIALNTNETANQAHHDGS